MTKKQRPKKRRNAIPTVGRRAKLRKEAARQQLMRGDEPDARTVFEIRRALG